MNFKGCQAPLECQSYWMGNTIALLNFGGLEHQLIIEFYRITSLIEWLNFIRYRTPFTILLEFYWMPNLWEAKIYCASYFIWLFLVYGISKAIEMKNFIGHRRKADWNQIPSNGWIIPDLAHLITSSPNVNNNKFHIFFGSLSTSDSMSCCFFFAVLINGKHQVRIAKLESRT